MGCLNNKFCLLLWKNYILQKRNPFQTIVEILVPLVFTGILLYHRVDSETLYLANKNHNSKFVEDVAELLPWFLMLSYMYSVANISKSIVHEREQKLRESMKMMGLPGWLHWCAWLAKSYILLGISAIFMTICYKWRFTFESWRGDGGDPVKLAILTFADRTVLFVFLLSYIFSLITFGFLIASLFSTANSSAAGAGFLHLLSFLPYALIPSDMEVSVTQKLGSSLLCNSAIGFGFEIISRFEMEGVGIQWSNIATPGTPDDPISLLIVLVMLILDGFIYLFLAIYIEAVFPGEFGMQSPWYFPFMPSYWCGGGSMGRSTKVQPVEESSHIHSDFFEKEPVDANVGIKIMGLRKVFGSMVAVDNLELNFYENQVTALLGHNGAGKTTTMSIITGLYRPTSGTALVNGFDIRTEIRKVHKSMGMCPQHNVLFDELTVEEHLRFFCLLKGYNGDVEAEIVRMLSALQLSDKRMERSSTLSGGMKRKLSVGIALIGGSRVVMLDEPTAGMDPGARRAIWDLIISHKQGKTILLSTHFMDEADLLGDRIAILAHGKAVCCGSSLFLKQKYGGGYHLVMVKEPNCQVNRITELIQKHMPEVNVDQNIGTELSYSLPDHKVSLFPVLFEELEKRKTELGVSSYGCSKTLMEEVFIRAGEQVEKEAKQWAQTLQSADTIKSESKAPTANEQSSEISQSKSKVPSKQEINRDSKIVTEVEAPASQFVSINTAQMRNRGAVLLFQQLCAMLVKKWQYSIRSKFALIVNALLPILFLSGILYVLRGDADPMKDFRGGFIPLIVSFTMVFLAASFIIFPIKERASKSKHLQFLSGVPFSVYWLGHLIFDGLYYLAVCIIMTWILAVFPIAFFRSAMSLLKFFLLLILYGWAVIPMCYQFSFRYSDSSSGYVRMVFFYWTTTIVASILSGYCIYKVEINTDPQGAPLCQIWKLPFQLLVPGMDLMVGIFIAMLDDIMMADDAKEKTAKIPDRPIRYKEKGILQYLVCLFLNGILCHVLVYFSETGIVEAVVEKTAGIVRKFRNRGTPMDPMALEDSDVLAENDRVRGTDIEELFQTDTIVLKDLTKYYGSFLAVDKLCLGVKHGECFGLLGVNGAGKTTTFTMLTGDEPISEGDAFITGKSVTEQRKEVQKVIGYCPQFDAIIPELTGAETIRLFARLRGVRESAINNLITMLGADLLLTEHMHKPCGSYSGGNKRKLSTAIALIGNPALIFLDEPTAGLDPVARRHLWNAVIKVLESGTSVVLTSHSMDECEALCTRLAIMVNGRFRCLGSTQHLKNKFGDGYTIIAQLPPLPEEQPTRTRTSLETGRRRQSLNGPPEAWELTLQPLRHFIETNFPDCVLKDMHPCYVYYHIPMDGPTTWSQMFKKMEEAKALYQLEAYSVGQTSLEQVFLGFAKGQLNEEDNNEDNGDDSRNCCSCSYWLK